MERSGPFDIDSGDGGAPPRPVAPRAESPQRTQRPRREPPRRSPRSPQPRRGQAPPGGEPQIRGSETLARIAWALPWIAFAVTVIAVGGGVFALAMIGLAWVALAELYRMTPEARSLMPVAMAVAAGLIAAAFWGTHLQIVLVAVAAFPLMFAAAAFQRDRRGIVGAMAITVFGLVWIAIPFAHAVLLRELPEHGGALLINVLVATFVADTAAYAGGRLFGRHRLAPSLSPNKTVEGLAAGLVGGALGFWFAGLYQDWLPGIDALLMGVIVASVAPFGDLFESMVKRDLGAKDSGSIFGPHGGLLDRVDGVLFTVVVGYYISLAFVY